MIVWSAAPGGQWYAYVASYQVGAVYTDSSGFLKAWVWPLESGQKVWLTDHITVAKAKADIEARLKED